MIAGGPPRTPAGHADGPSPGRLAARAKFTWALGSLGDNYAGNTIGQLKDAVYTVALGVAPELIGWALALPRMLDAFLDPIIGYWSDRTKSPWGRRRPYIFCGAIALGLTMTFLWLPPAHAGWSQRALAAYFLVTTTLFYAAYSLFLVPYRALGLALSSDYHERTRLQAWGMMLGLVGGLGLPWLYKLALVVGGNPTGSADTAEAILLGARWVGGGVGVLILITCLAPALLCREPSEISSAARISLRQALTTTVRNRACLHLLGMNFAAIVGMYAPVTATLLVSIYSLFHGDQQAAATLTGSLGMAQMLGSLLGVPICTAASVPIGKRRAALFSLVVGALGFASLWFTLRPAHPYWAAPSYLLIGAGMQGVWLMSATMNADVCDSDELLTGQRREGVYGAVFALEQKIAFAAAALLGGYLVSRTGFLPNAMPSANTLEALRQTLVLTPLVGLALAALAIAAYPLSRRRVIEIQTQLAALRAKPDLGR